MKLLVVRNSALGDVTLVHTCLEAMNAAYPETEILFLTKAPFQQMFTDLKNVTTLTGEYRNKHKGLNGLLNLAAEIYTTYKPDVVVDLHNVLRSKFICTYFKAKRVPVFTLHKNRKTRWDLISGRTKKQLPHIIEKYCEVFREAGFDILPEVLEQKSKGHTMVVRNPLTIGIAPFAKHTLKSWPVTSMIELMRLIQSRYPVEFFLFGGKEDLPVLESIGNQIPNCKIIAGKYSLKEELNIMATLRTFISMDSANMHLADLAGTRVFSIWGATDPLAGFYAWHQPEQNSISISTNELPCRPCTIYGKGTCYRKDVACLNWLTPQRVFQKMEEQKAFT